MPPTTGLLDAVLRREVGMLRARESRRVFDPSVHVGVLGQDHAGAVVAARDRPVLDPGLRADVVARLLEEGPDSWRTLWVVRPGVPEQHDDDLAWLAAGLLAFGMHARPLDGCYVLTRTGWRCVLTGRSRTWVRLRLDA